MNFHVMKSKLPPAISRWSLRALLIGLTFASIALYFLGSWWNEYSQYSHKKQMQSRWNNAGAIITGLNSKNDVALIANIGPPRFDTNSLKNISQIPNLKHVVLVETQVVDADLIHVGKLPELKSVALNKTRITDDGLLHLAKLKSLRDLHLAYTKITDKSVSTLSNFQTLQSLHIRGTEISKSGIKEIQDALPNTKIYSDIQDSSQTFTPRNDIAAPPNRLYNSQFLGIV